MTTDVLAEISHCPERVAYKKFLNADTSGMDAKEWTSTLKSLKEAYKLSFHNYFAEVHPHLLFEIGEEKVFWEYTDGVYEEKGFPTIREYVIKLLIDEGLRESATETFARNVISRYRACFQERGVSYDDFDTVSDEFHCKNGWIHLKTGTFTPHTPDKLSRRVSAVTYDKDATCPLYDALLDTKLGIPKDQVRVLDQYSGLLLTDDITKQKMLAIIGKPGCGKSTLIELWMAILGDCAVKHSLTDLSGDSSRFMGSSFIDRTLCWFDEVEPNRSKMGDKLIGMITADQINVERKGVNGITKAQNKLKFILTANALPRSAEIGIYRRLLLIHFENSFYDSVEIDYNIKEKLEKEMSGVFNRMVRGLHDLRKIGTFSVMENHTELIESYKTSSNTISEFLDEYFVFDYDAEPIDTSVLLKNYKEFTNDSYTKSLTPQRFGVLISQNGLMQFDKIYPKKGTGGVRQWAGLKLKDIFEIDHAGFIRYIHDDF